MSLTDSSPDPTLADLHITDLRRIHLNPGDRLAAIVQGPATPAQLDRIRDHLLTAIPNTPILIYTNDLELVTLGPGEHPTRTADGTVTADPDAPLFAEPELDASLRQGQPG